MKSAVIVDVDGTVALRPLTEGARGPYDWARVGEDVPNVPVIELLQCLRNEWWQTDFIVVSGRSDICREETGEWIMLHGVPCDYLHMRERGDNRPDVEVKAEIYLREIKPYYRVRCVFDDRNAVVEMWRYQFGLTVMQVAEGNF
jgi:hypothetical protein